MTEMLLAKIEQLFKENQDDTAVWDFVRDGVKELILADRERMIEALEEESNNVENSSFGRGQADGLLWAIEYLNNQHQRKTT